MTKLVHINKIEFIRSSELSGLIRVTNSSCRIPSDVNFTEINEIVNLVGVKMEDESQKGETVYTTTVTFQTKRKDVVRWKRIAFRLTSIDGNQFLVGTGSRPYPVVKENNTFPEKPGDSTLKTVTITWRSLLPMLYIVK